MKDFRYMSIVAAAALGLAVAGCGSSGSDSDSPTTTGPTELTPEEKRIAELEKEIKDEKERADNLQKEKDREQSQADVAVAKALFAALGQPRTSLGSSPKDGGDTAPANRGTGSDTAVTIPALGEADEMGMFSKKVGTTQWSAVVHTTKEAATTRLLAEVLASNAGYDGTRLTLGTSADRNIKSPSFPQESGTRPYLAGNRQFPGTYMGAGGQYACTGDACSAEWTEAGIVLSGNWTFTPGDNVRATIPDSAFQSYGWWLQKNADGTMDAGPVHFTTAAFAATGVTALQGSAEYVGSVAGKYAIYSGAFSDRSEAGHFDADVTLTADFGNATESGRVSGIINGFVTEAGDKDDWSVRLNPSGTDASDGLSDAGVFTGTTAWKIGTVTSNELGSYNGALYNSDKTGQDGVPYEAGGTFEAPFEGGVGQMVGAFGATRDKKQ